MPWPKRPKIDVLTLQRENDGLRTTIVCLKREIENKAGHVQRLEALLCSRLQKIDELNAKLDQAREQIKRLDQEKERLAAITADQRGMTAEPAQTQSQA